MTGYVHVARAINYMSAIRITFLMPAKIVGQTSSPHDAAAHNANSFVLQTNLGRLLQCHAQDVTSKHKTLMYTLQAILQGVKLFRGYMIRREDQQTFVRPINNMSRKVSRTETANPRSDVQLNPGLTPEATYPKPYE